MKKLQKNQQFMKKISNESETKKKYRIFKNKLTIIY